MDGPVPDPCPCGFFHADYVCDWHLWVDLGQPCPVCVLTEPHWHNRKVDGTLGNVVKVP